MCSIGGFISENPLPPELAENLCAALCYYGIDRGSQSAGVYANGKVYKKAVSGADIIKHPEFGALFTKPVSIALTHNRQPTCGGLGDEQAQPFVSGEVATVHNGWYHDLKSIKEKWNISKPSGVDSELPTQFISQYGINALTDFLNTAEGSSALAVVVGNDLYLTRAGGPIAYQFLIVPQGNILIFASTRTILMAALRFVWLLPDSVRGTDLKEDILFQASALKLTEIGKHKKPAYVWRGQPYCADTKGDEHWRGHRGRHNTQQSLPIVRSDKREQNSKDHWRKVMLDEGWVESETGVWTHSKYSGQVDV